MRAAGAQQAARRELRTLRVLSHSYAVRGDVAGVVGNEDVSGDVATA
jgi:hypothetical protein